MRATFLVFGLSLIVMLSIFIRGKKAINDTNSTFRIETKLNPPGISMGYLSSDYIMYKKQNLNRENYFDEPLSEKILFKQFVKVQKAKKFHYRYKFKRND